MVSIFDAINIVIGFLFIESSNNVIITFVMMTFDETGTSSDVLNTLIVRIIKSIVVREDRVKPHLYGIL